LMYTVLLNMCYDTTKGNPLTFEALKFDVCVFPAPWKCF